MTINSTIRKAGPFIGNGTASSFPFTYKVFQASDLDVVRLDQSTNVETTLVLTTDYTVTLNQDQDSNPGGTVTLVAGALAAGYTLTMTSDVPNLQPTDLTNQGGFYPEVINDALDRATIQIQQLQEQTDRSFKVAISSNVDATLPPPNANDLIGWNATGDALQNVDPGSLATVVAYSTAYCDVFVGNGITTSWTLTKAAGNLFNLDVSINGSTQEPTRDYTLSGTTFAMTTPPPIGARVVVKYKEGLANYVGDSQDIRYVQAGTGAVQRSVQAKLREGYVDVTDYIAVGEADHSLGAQRAFNAAFNMSPKRPVRFPAGEYNLVTQIDARGLSFYGDDRYLSKLVCAAGSNTRQFINGGQFIEKLYFYSTNSTDAFAIGGYKNYIVDCWFQGMGDCICGTGIFVTVVVNKCEFLGCNSAMSDKLHDGSSAHTTVWFTDSNVLYGNKGFDIKTEAAGFLVEGCVFEDMAYVWYGYGAQIFNSVWTKNWVEQVYKNCTLYHNVFAGSHNMHIYNDLRPGGKSITDANRWATSQWATGGAAQSGGGGASFGDDAIRLNDFNGQGILVTTGGVKPSCAQASFSVAADLTYETQAANSNAASRGGDMIIKTGVGSNTQRKGALRTYDDNGTQLGDASNRWSVVYAGTGTINTSDANEKQQVRELANAEKAVAQSIKSLIRAFKFNDAVASKGDKARIHFGVIAQDVAKAFSDQGLDANDYAMFCRDVWHTIIDQETGESVQAYPDQAGKYPADAQRHERLGVRYEELLAFVISAL